MQIDTQTLRLPETQYFHGQHPKSAVILHHTVGGSARSTFNHWLQDERRIGTAYLIERDGTVFEVFPPECWASHIAAHDERGHWIRSLEHRSIGIEIASEGALEVKDGGLYAFGGRKKINRAFHEVYEHSSPWRGYQYWDSYSREQITATAELIRHLCDKFRIPKTTPANHLDCKAEYRTFSSVLGHAHLRPDKSDPSPQIWTAEFLSAAGLSLT